MYATTGFTEVDLLVGDAGSSRGGSILRRASPRPGHLPGIRVFHDVPAIAPSPFLAAGHVTFGSLVSAYKITDAVIASWSRSCVSARRTPAAAQPGAGQASNRANIVARFAANGIATSLLSLEGGGEHLEFLRTYDRIDIALDAFPYSGGTSTAEAIWQGVPLLTFNGDRWACRTSRSILEAAGLGGGSRRTCRPSTTPP